MVIITETKKKLKGTKNLSYYSTQYSGVPQDKQDVGGINGKLHICK